MGCSELWKDMHYQRNHHIERPSTLEAPWKREALKVVLITAANRIQETYVVKQLGSILFAVELRTNFKDKKSVRWACIRLRLEDIRGSIW